MKTKAVALPLASIQALLLADPVAGFLPAVVSPAATTGFNLGAAHVVARTTLCAKRPRRITASVGEAARMAVGGGEREAVVLKTSDKVPRGPAGAIKLT